MPKIDEKGESGQNLNDIDTQNEADKVEISIKDQVPRIERIGDGDNQLTVSSQSGRLYQYTSWHHYKSYHTRPVCRDLC